MAERLFVIKKSSLFDGELDVSECGSSFAEVTDNGWVSPPETLGSIIDEYLKMGDVCVLKFDLLVPDEDRRMFREGLSSPYRDLTYS